MRTAASVLPSPVASWTRRPLASATPAAICTSNGRRPRRAVRELARDGEDVWQERIERFAFGPRSKVAGPLGQGRQRQAGNVYGGDGCDRLEIGSNVVLDAIACRTAVALAPLVGARPVRRVGHPFECTLEAISYQLSAISWIPEQIAGSSRSHVRSRDNGAAATDSGVTSY